MLPSPLRARNNWLQWELHLLMPGPNTVPTECKTDIWWQLSPPAPTECLSPFWSSFPIACSCCLITSLSVFPSVVFLKCLKLWTNKQRSSNRHGNGYFLDYAASESCATPWQKDIMLLFVRPHNFIAHWTLIIFSPSNLLKKDALKWKC